MKYWLYDLYQNIKGDLSRIHTSMTIWFNSVIGSAALFLPDLIALMPDIQEYIEVPTYKTWMLVLLVGNFILRFRTNKALRHK